MAEPISYVRVEQLEACGKASVPSLTCLPELAISSDQLANSTVKDK